MKNGDITDFLDQLYYGGELFFTYGDTKFFLQGWREDTISKMVLDVIDDKPFKSYLWEYEALTMKECADAFLAAPIWNGKDFLQIQNDVVWVDC